VDTWDKIRLWLGSKSYTNCLRPKKETNGMKKYLRGIKKAQNDLDILDIVNSIEKLKSGLSAIIGNNKYQLQLAKQLYL
jgi:hypothetical protein